MAESRQNADERVALEEVPCDFCGAREADAVLSVHDHTGTVPGRFQMVSCRQCGLRRTNPRPTLLTLGRAYPDDYAQHTAFVTPVQPPRGFLRWVLVNFRDYPLGQRSLAVLRWLGAPWAALRLRRRTCIGYLPFAGDGRLLDFGCGFGRYVAQMAAAGWKAEGLDLAPEAVEHGRAAGLTIHLGTLPGVPLPNDYYDLVTLWHSLEHVPSPMATLRALRTILKPGGRLMVVCPLSDSLNARWFGPDWYGVDLPRHLTHFTRATLRRHIETAGFRVERVLPIRRPTFVRRSFALMAQDTGTPLYRSLARSHLAARLLSHLALLLHRTDEALFVARRTL